MDSGDREIGLYLVAIGVGVTVGLTAPAVAPVLMHAITPVLGLLLFATFLGVPLGRVVRGVGDLRFLAALFAVDFVADPVLVWVLSRFVTADRGLLLGMLLVLLTPCVDYVIVFTGQAGGARDRLLAATPLLMLAQIAFLPLYLTLLAGPDALAVVDVSPFLEAFGTLIAAPLAAAAVVRAVGRRHRAGRLVEDGMGRAMVPLMMITLAVVIGSQVAAVGPRMGSLARLVPVYVAFVVVALLLGRIAARVARLDVPDTRAVLFSGVTRNSLVVLPLALALPASLDLAPLAVVMQTLVELVAMIVLVRLVPVLVPGSSPSQP